MVLVKGRRSVFVGTLTFPSATSFRWPQAGGAKEIILPVRSTVCKNERSREIDGGEISLRN